MSDPNIDPIIDFDQLLSDHLDGCLDGDDLRTLNAELERNAALRDQYNGLLADQKNLREMFRQSSSTTNGVQVGLSGDFASKVVAEATRQRAAQRNVVAASLKQPASPNRRIIAGIIATAAAVLVVATLASRNWSGAEIAKNSGAEIAKNDVQSLADPVEKPATDGQLDQSEAVPVAEMFGSQLAENTSQPRSPEPAAGQPERVAIDATENQDASSASMDRIARNMPSRKSNDAGMPLDTSASVSVQRQRDDSMSGAVVVYDVRLTTRGRVTQCIANTMKKVGMPETSRQPIDGQIVDAATSVDSFDADSKFQLLYLRAPAKQLDRLFKILLRDRENVSSLGLALVTDSPILKVTDNLQSVDSTLVRHEPGTASFELKSKDAGELEVLRRLLDDQTFLPLAPGMPATTGLNTMNPNSPAGSGLDVMTRVLLIVR